MVRVKSCDRIETYCTHVCMLFIYSQVNREGCPPSLQKLAAEAKAVLDKRQENRGKDAPVDPGMKILQRNYLAPRDKETLHKFLAIVRRSDEEKQAEKRGKQDVELLRQQVIEAQQERNAVSDELAAVLQARRNEKAESTSVINQQKKRIRELEAELDAERKRRLIGGVVA